jgi:hypothetical protein
MTDTGQFTLFSRILHWTMAAMILAMLFIGVAMVASLADYHLLVSIHRPLGIAILALAIIRYVNRRLNPPPDDVCVAADRMGNAIGGTLSDRALRHAASAPDPAAQSDALRNLAQDAHYRRIPVLRDLHHPFQRGSISHADLTRPSD